MNHAFLIYNGGMRDRTKMVSYEPAVNNILIIITSQIPKASFISFYGQKMHSAGKTRKKISGDE